MFVSCWSSKGGSGTSVVAATLVLLSGRETGGGALLVDLAGDAPAVLGLAEPSGPGLSDWLRAGPDAPVDALGRLELAVCEGIALLPRGGGELAPGARIDVLARLLATDPRQVVVDCGVVDGFDDPAATLAGAASVSLLVVRACYLALRRAVALPLRPSGVVLVEEPGRALDARDVQDVLGVPVVACVAQDPAVARAVDAGLLATRLPRALARSLRNAA
jgi:hypothetical protein